MMTSDRPGKGKARQGKATIRHNAEKGIKMMRSNGGVVVAIVLVFPIIVVVVSLYCFGGRNRESQNASQSSRLPGPNGN
jgi:uncharacterized membrane protein